MAGWEVGEGWEVPGGVVGEAGSRVGSRAAVGTSEGWVEIGGRTPVSDGVRPGGKTCREFVGVGKMPTCSTPQAVSRNKVMANKSGLCHFEFIVNPFEKIVPKMD